MERFRCYIEGGQITGNIRTYPPCLDISPPRQIRRVELPYQLYFGGESSAWGGGVAFIRHAPGASTISRAYLITPEQFTHLVAQENRLEHLGHLPLLEAMSSGRAAIAEPAGRYDELIFCGKLSGRPVFAFTSAREQPLNAPAPAYLRTIGRGLSELGLTRDEIIHYLAQAPGTTEIPISAN